jgi:hypothetical protein
MLSRIQHGIAHQISPCGKIDMLDNANIVVHRQLIFRDQADADAAKITIEADPIVYWHGAENTDANFVKTEDDNPEPCILPYHTQVMWSANLTDTAEQLLPLRVLHPDSQADAEAQRDVIYRVCKKIISR